MTQKELEGLLAEWQAILRLRDWEVRVRFVDPKALEEGNLAQCEPSAPRKIATIKILDPREPSPEKGRRRDPEADLVHELLHLHMEPLAPDDWKSHHGLFLEQAIDLIAEALVRLKRAGKRPRSKER